MHHSIQAIGHIITPFTQKFSIPRQGISLCPAKGEIVFAKHIDAAQALDGIEGFSHLWLLFLFHENIEQGYKPKVRPPRLGGNKKIGVFASRSSFRPNAIGMSVVKNEGVVNNRLYVSGVDLLSNTPIVDIKPYLPYADLVNNAHGGYADEKPLASLRVNYTELANDQLAQHDQQYPDLRGLLNTLLEQDPRPSYKHHKLDEKIYFIQLYNIEVKWTVTEDIVTVLEVYCL